MGWAVTQNAYRVLDLIAWIALAGFGFYKARSERFKEGTPQRRRNFPKGWWKGYYWFTALSLAIGGWHLFAYLKVWGEVGHSALSFRAACSRACAARTSEESAVELRINKLQIPRSARDDKGFY